MVVISWLYCRPSSCHRFTAVSLVVAVVVGIAAGIVVAIGVGIGVGIVVRIVVRTVLGIVVANGSTCLLNCCFPHWSTFGH